MVSETPSPVRTTPRRTQQQRREATRTRLLEATVSSLVELGYGATTTLEVEKRAGASRGARIHHYPTKAALLASAVDHVYDRVATRYDQAFGKSGPGQTDMERFGEGFDLLWAIYRGPEFTAVLELNMAARTDPDLAEHLKLVGDRHRALAAQAGHTYFPTLDEDTIVSLVETIHTVMLGVLVQRHLNTDPDYEAKVFAHLLRIVALHLEE